MEIFLVPRYYANMPIPFINLKVNAQKKEVVVVGFYVLWHFSNVCFFYKIKTLQKWKRYKRAINTNVKTVFFTFARNQPRTINRLHIHVHTNQSDHFHSAQIPPPRTFPAAADIHEIFAITGRQQMAAEIVLYMF